MGTNLDSGFYLFAATDKGIATRLNENTLLVGSVVSRNVINRDLSAPPGGESDENVYIVGSLNDDIDTVSTVNGTFTLDSGDNLSSVFVNGVVFRVKGSTGNDGQFTVSTSEYTGGKTVITVTGTISDGTGDGIVYWATEDWNGKVDDIAVYYDSEYYFFTPSDGLIMYNSDDSEEVQFNSTTYLWGTYVIPTGGIPSGIPATSIADGTVSNAEFQYINSVTSNVQDQIDAFGTLDPDSKTVFTVSNEGQTTYAVGASYRSGSTRLFQDRMPLLRKIGADTGGFYDYEESGNNIILARGLPLNTKLVIEYVAG